jgi:hypothetical protein
MLLKLGRRLRTEEAGQSFVLAAVSLLILALVATATLQVGFGVHQRIQLQNATDASAYSQAALVARTLNYFAFTNRTQIVHYVCALALQAIPAVWSAIVAMLCMMRDLIGTLLALACLCCEFCLFLEEIMCPLAVALGIAFAIIDPIAIAAQDLEDPIDKLSYLVPLFQYLNQYLLFYGMKAIKWLTDASLGIGAAGLFGFTDTNSIGARTAQTTSPNAQLDGILGAAFQAFNMEAYATMFDTNSESFEGNNVYNGSGSDPHAQAQRVMTEVINATRTGNTSPCNTPLTDRSIIACLAGGFLSKILAFLGIQHHGQSKYMNPFDSGTFETTSNYIWTTAVPYSQLSQGVSLDSADYVSIMPLSGIIPGKIMDALKSLGLQTYMVTGIQSAASTVNTGGASVPSPTRYHCRYNGYWDIPTEVCTDFYITKPEKCSDEGDIHNWPGLANFMKFNPNSNSAIDFNQSSFFAAWKLAPECASFNTVQGGKCVDLLPFGFGGFGSNSNDWTDPGTYNGSAGQMLNGRVGDIQPISLLGSGLHTLAVAQVYYHRPQWWWEHPNFFNPFWRAKLAPLQDKMKRLPGGSALETVTNDVTKALNSVPGGVLPSTFIMH